MVSIRLEYLNIEHTKPPFPTFSIYALARRDIRWTRSGRIGACVGKRNVSSEIVYSYMSKLQNNNAWCGLTLV